jgi:glycosyltransferase involved in cell wall biosynthesis
VARDIPKKVANSNKYTKVLARKAKRAAILAIGETGTREAYNLNAFYPTVNEYYYQQQDTIKDTDPLISILLPAYNTPEPFLRECLESIIVQSYSKWELCIADDNSSDERVVRIIKEYIAKEPRIKLKVREKNGHISEATNSALKLAKGEFVALMDHDDVLWPNALYEMLQVIRTDKNVDFIYSDEDKIDGTGKIHNYPFLKPDYSPEFLESCNYITHFSCIRTSIMQEVGGFRKGYEGAQDWDLFIRITEKTSNIVHIPKILYSWRIHEASTASDTDAKPYVYEAQKKLLTDHIERLGKKGEVVTGLIPQHRTIKYEVAPKSMLTVAILHTTSSSTIRLLNTLSKVTPGADYEIICVHSEALSPYDVSELRDVASKAPTRFQMLKVNHRSNTYAEVANSAKGSHILFINDNLEIVSEDWAKLLMGDADINGVGLVSPVILEPNKATIISAGIGLGYGKNGWLNMLQGTPFDDPHYTRGLYAKSRRNVSATHVAVFAIKKSTLLSTVTDLASQVIFVKYCLALLDEGYRHIYSPYIQVVAHGTLPELGTLPGDFKEDPYLNPNFNHDNQRMEVKG